MVECSAELVPLRRGRGGLVGAFKLGLKRLAGVSRVDEGKKIAQAEGTACAKDRGQVRSL